MHTRKYDTCIHNLTLHTWAASSPTSTWYSLGSVHWRWRRVLRLYTVTRFACTPTAHTSPIPCNLTFRVFSFPAHTSLHLLASTGQVLWQASPRARAHLQQNQLDGLNSAYVSSYYIIMCVFEFAIKMGPKRSKQTDHFGSLSMAVTLHPPLHVSSLTLKESVYGPLN